MRPALLNETLQLRTHPDIFFAGQISGVEGYVESIATGLVAGLAAAGQLQRRDPRAFPARDGDRLAVPLHFARRSEAVSAGEHRLRSVSAARPATRKTGANARRRCAGVALGKAGRATWPCMSELATRHRGLSGRTAPPQRFAAYAAQLWSGPAGVHRILLAARYAAAARSASFDLLALREWLAHLYDREAEARHHPPQTGVAARVLPVPFAGTPDRARSGAAAAAAEDAEDAAGGAEHRSDECSGGCGTAAGIWSGRTRTRDRLLLEMLYGCGLRISEAVGLNLEDFDRDRALGARAGQGAEGAAGAVWTKAAAALGSVSAVGRRHRRDRACS